MHVTSRPLVLALALVPALTLLACDAPAASSKADGASKITDASAPALPSASAPTDPALLRVAVDARDAATAIAKVCHLDALYQPARFVETCSWRPSDVEAFRTAATALRAYPALPHTGRGASFVEEIRLFAEWVALVHETDIYPRGTLRHYQQLALAWNAWQPADKIIVDVGKLSYRSAYGTPDAPDGGYVVWKRCADGQCLYPTDSH